MFNIRSAFRIVKILIVCLLCISATLGSMLVFNWGIRVKTSSGADPPTNSDVENIQLEDYEFSIEHNEITLGKYIGESTLVSVPETVNDKKVVSIGNACFAYSDIVSVEIPTNIKEIGSYAFCGCSSLSKVTLSDGLECIGEQAFEGCTSIESIELPATVTTIKMGAFKNCSSLTSVLFSHWTDFSIGNFAFKGSGLSAVSIPSNCTFVGSGAFSDCPNLKGLSITESTEYTEDITKVYKSSVSSPNYSNNTTPKHKEENNNESYWNIFKNIFN